MVIWLLKLYGDEDEINKSAAYEKLPGIGPHPRGLHLWWARRPFGAARAILFAQLVNDPGGERGWGRYAGQTKEDAQRERESLFKLIRKLCDWKNTENEDIIEKAKSAIRMSWQETCELNNGKNGFDSRQIPAFHDTFAGGGALPIEAQRLGLESYASDLNPISVLINKATIEIPSKFYGKRPVSISINNKKNKKRSLEIGSGENWPGSTGLSEDVKYYGNWINNEVTKKIGHLYPDIYISKEIVKKRKDLKSFEGKRIPVIAWIWVRTVKCNNPACECEMPLAKSFLLSTKKSNYACVKASSISAKRIIFNVLQGDLTNEEIKTAKVGSGFLSAKGKKLQSTFRCLCCGHPVKATYVDREAAKGDIGHQLMAIVAQGNRKKIYLDPDFYDFREIRTEISKLLEDSSIQLALPNQKCLGTFA